MHREKTFVPAFFKVCIDELFDNREFGKVIIVLEKSLEKSLEFWIQLSVRSLSHSKCCLQKYFPAFVSIQAVIL